MNLSILVEKALKTLKDAGWYRGRKMNIIEVKECMVKSGYELYPPVIAFIEEFDMLEFKNLDRYGDEECHEICAKEAITWYTYNPEDCLSRLCGEKLVPVGFACNHNLILFVSESGNVYMETRNLGNDFLKAIGKMVL
jgi:hypothetical protein